MNAPRTLGETEHGMPSSACLNCGHVMDRASGVGHDSQPTPGDMSLCIRCGHLMAFDEDLRLREPTGAEFVAAATDPNVVAAKRAVAALARRQGGRS